MPRSMEACRFRKLTSSGTSGEACCLQVGEVTGIADPELQRVLPEACEACCRTMRDQDAINPVVASLVYNAVSRVIETGGHPECSVERAQQLKQFAIGHLGVIVEELPDHSYPPESYTPGGDVTQLQVECSERFTWSVGLLTAPRRVPTILPTIQSLKDAGFERVHVFAEPGSLLPPECPDLAVTIHRRRLGNFVNFYSSLSRLLADNPASDAFAIFQDDVEAAAGLKDWCDQQLWPLDSGVVSLFTPRLHSSRTVGWHLRSPGYNRVCGAQAFVFRRDMLQRFLSDPHVVRHLEIKVKHDDTVVAEWVAREGIGIAYHTPSLVQHVGAVSSIFEEGPDQRNVATAISNVDEMDSWQPADDRPALGLVGWNTPTGLGYQNRDLAIHGEVDRWLIPQHPSLNGLDLPSTPARIDVTERPLDDNQLKQWLVGLDWVLFVERPYLDNLPRVAAHAGIGVACAPNYEWLDRDLVWLTFVDLMLCPTRQTTLQMQDWKRRYGFGWEVVHVPWPIDTTRFRFRERHTCRRFLYVNGWGGGVIERLDRTIVEYGRKGLELIVGAARLAPRLEFVVYSLTSRPKRLPRNIEWRAPPTDNVELYRDGDVCVQPSHFEGLGLQLLECQASGLPLVTTGAPPMNEYNPMCTIPTCGTEVVQLGGPISSHLMEPRDLVATLKPLVGNDVRAASHRAREFVACNHSWDNALGVLRQAIRKR